MEWIGSFEVPGSGRRVGGKLVISDTESQLTTFGPLVTPEPLQSGDTFPPHSRRKVSVVHGWSGSKPLTLLNLDALDIAMVDDWRTQERWLCQMALEAELPADHPLTFSGGQLDLTYLPDFVPPAESALGSGMELADLIGRHRRIIADVDLADGGGLQLIQEDVVNQTLDGFTLEADVFGQYWVPDSRPPQKLVNAMVTPIEALIWLATDKHSELGLWLALEERLETYGRLWVSLIKPRRFEPPKGRLAPYEVLFKAEELPGGIVEGIQHWYRLWPSLKHVVGPLLARSRARWAYTEDPFSTVVAALEEYSKRRINGGPLERAEFRKRRRRICDLVSAEEPDLAAWADESLRLTNRFTLNERLTRLLDEADKIGSDIAGTNPALFVAQIVKARNQLAHGSIRDGELQDGGSLFWRHRGLLWLMRYYLLLELGFSVAEAERRIVRQSRFRHEIAKLHERSE
jgi:hypothetical protein